MLLLSLTLHSLFRKVNFLGIGSNTISANLHGIFDTSAHSGRLASLGGPNYYRYHASWYLLTLHSFLWKVNFPWRVPAISAPYFTLSLTLHSHFLQEAIQSPTRDTHCDRGVPRDFQLSSVVDSGYPVGDVVAFKKDAFCDHPCSSICCVSIKGYQEKSGNVTINTLIRHPLAAKRGSKRAEADFQTGKGSKNRGLGSKARIPTRRNFLREKRLLFMADSDRLISYCGKLQVLQKDYRLNFQNKILE
ncbi:hypothetical protein AVEN_201133-1 [Araneus ventricosus]|uniref:Uncharacterized protein n=1 Tax=Araneus ventricosus TaxID=182803 RepID=A0A4Y2IJR2_ARAVE|nr:hypothetical protein AVEN_201133-1 [Araneus ventricosus]